MRFASDDYQALQGMAASGIGVALIPMLATVSSRNDVVVAAAARPRAGAADPRGGAHGRAEPAGRAHDRVAAQRARVLGRRPALHAVA